MLQQSIRQHARKSHTASATAPTPSAPVNKGTKGVLAPFPAATHVVEEGHHDG